MPSLSTAMHVTTAEGGGGGGGGGGEEEECDGILHQ